MVLLVQKYRRHLCVSSHSHRDDPEGRRRRRHLEAGVSGTWVDEVMDGHVFDDVDYRRLGYNGNQHPRFHQIPTETERYLLAGFLPAPDQAGRGHVRDHLHLFCKSRLRRVYLGPPHTRGAMGWACWTVWRLLRRFRLGGSPDRH